ncbi:MAG TPA: universal stress protein [Caldilineaceae bacterium]|nr:universal stress protein [Caldilineaceae bacterium]
MFVVFNNILVPLDGSALATCVLPHVVSLTQALGSNLMLMHVLDDYDTPGRIDDPVDWPCKKAEIQSYLNRLSTDGATKLGKAPSLKLIEGPAERGIIEYAQHQDVDLVALSSHGQGGLSGWNTSSVAQKVIDRVRKSILLIRAYEPVSEDYTAGHWRAFRYRRILVPLDGSQRAEQVLPMATALAHAHEAELLLVHIIAKPESIGRVPVGAGDTRLLDQMIERKRAQAIQHFTSLQSRLPVVWQLRIDARANVAATLHNIVEKEKADLVILSAHGHSGRHEWSYGSIASSFLTYGTTPLLILQDLQPHEILSSKVERAAGDIQSPPNVIPKHDPDLWDYLREPTQVQH